MSMMKMKRKEVDDFSDDFSDFSLSSPSRKIRRLDVDLPPIMEEEEVEIHTVVADQNQERAIVLFKPTVNTHPLLYHSPSNFSVSVDSDLISGFKNKFLWSSCSDSINSAEEEAVPNECKAVVPWVNPSQLSLAQGMSVSEAEAPELMEAEQAGEEETMDIEGNISDSLEQEKGNVFGGLPQWQQQHCMIPQLSHNTFTPVTWFH